MIEQATATTINAAFHDQRLVRDIQEIDSLDDTQSSGLENALFGIVAAILLTAPAVLSLFLTGEVGAVFARWHQFSLTDGDTLTAYIIAFILQAVPMALVLSFAITIKNGNKRMAALIICLWLPFAATSGYGQYLYLIHQLQQADQLISLARSVCCTLTDLVAALLLMILQRRTLARHEKSIRLRARAVRVTTAANLELRQELADSQQRLSEAEQRFDRQQREYAAVNQFRDQILAAGLAALAAKNTAATPGVEGRATWGA